MNVRRRPCLRCATAEGDTADGDTAGDETADGEAADGALADADRVTELAGGCEDAAGARPPQPAPARATAAASTVGTATARILVMPAEPTGPATGP